jgi:shikimate dehydrogenase
MRKFGLIGFPLGHSFSKKYFREKFEREKITDCRYDNYPIESIEKLSDIIHENPELCGLNVTIPYKTAVLDFAGYKDPAVIEIGAANVLKIKRGKDKINISAFNSDITGITDSLSPFVTGNVKKAMILGSGGSSRAVAYTLKKMGLEIINVSRRKSPGSLTYAEIDQDILENTDLLINTTPLGMYPDISSKPSIDYNLLNEKHILFDLVYNPEMTSFLRMGQERGCRIITGLKMLYSQAERSWEIWNDPDL